ncbi:MAG: AAA family ATPase [Verrucomicrobiota bacterium]|nr:AAA family ATPase [Verrucomicrobiota bacterium]
MNSENPEITSLREALLLSPDNLPLRRVLADALMRGQCFREAAEEYKRILKHTSGDHTVLFALANALWRAGAVTETTMVLENLIRNHPKFAEGRLLYARALQHDGELEKAAYHYKLTIADHPELADLSLEHALRSQLEGEKRSGPETQRVPDGEIPENFEPDIEKPKINFSDVGGMESVKEEVRMKIILPLQNPELFKAYGKVAGGGILLYGPPGCGKTHIARATAGEVKAAFISVGISDVLDMWIGQSERNLHELFDQARRNRPCVLFFDEVDALGANRADLRKHAGRNLINQFLAEMDGIDVNNEGVLILAATNAPWHLDPAFRRPGRFDRVIFVPPPDMAARESILKIHLKGKPGGEMDVRKTAEKTAHYSGADLKGVIETAIEGKLRAAMKTGKIEPLNHKDILDAASKIKPSTREWFSTARNHALYANQSGQYDEILQYMKAGKL